MSKRLCDECGEHRPVMVEIEGVTWLCSRCYVGGKPLDAIRENLARGGETTITIEPMKEGKR